MWCVFLLSFDAGGERAAQGVAWTGLRRCELVVHKAGGVHTPVSQIVASGYMYVMLLYRFWSEVS